MTGFTQQIRTGLHKYRIIVALGVIAGLAELGYATMNQSALQPYVVNDLKLGAEWLGWIMAVFLVVEALFRPAMGALGDRIGRRPLLIFGPIASCITALLMIRVSDPAAIIALRVLDGLGAAAIWPTAFALVGDAVEEENRSVAMSVLNVTYMVGLALGPLLGGFVNDYTGSMRAAFYPISMVFALTMVAALTLLPKTDPRHGHDKSIGEPAEYHLSFLLYSLKLIPHMLVMVFFAFTAIGLLIPIVKLYAMDELGLSETGYGILLLPVAAILALLAMPLGRLGDKWGKAESVRLGISLTALAMWIIAGTKLLAALVVAGSLLGIGFLIAMPAWLALVSNLTSAANRGQVMGAIGMAQGLGAILGAVAGGYLYAGNITLGPIYPHSAPFVLSAALLTLSAVLTFVFLKRKEPAKIAAQ